MVDDGQYSGLAILKKGAFFGEDIAKRSGTYKANYRLIKTFGSLSMPQPASDIAYWQ